MNVIIQAGGKGSRLRHHTWNKPKCLISIDSKPIIYHLFDKFKNDNFYIIGDYMFDTIETYLNFNEPNVNYFLIKSSGSGNCSGISDALQMIEDNEPILLIWSDLIISENIDFSKFKKTTIFTSSKIKTRYGINNENKISLGDFENGIIGAFYFPNKTSMSAPNIEGEYVEWFSANQPEYDIFKIDHIDELGDFSHYEDQISLKSHCRFFNDVTINEDNVIKKCINKNFDDLIDKEQSWYHEIRNYNFKRIPKIYSTDPYIMERIIGHHAFELEDVSNREKTCILVDILDNLNDLHDKDKINSISDDLNDVYINKTIKRLQTVSNLFNFQKQDTLTINGIKCKNLSFDNLFSKFKSFEKTLNSHFFTPIHGDSTFSNIIIDKYLRSWLIDPRGYFAKKGIWGDPLYDFSKLFYSVYGNYDKFNRRKFKLFINDSNIEIMIEDNIFKNVRDGIFNEYFEPDDLYKIKIIHSMIWFSLAGYVLDDLDSIYASFYLGLYWMEKALS